MAILFKMKLCLVIYEYREELVQSWNSATKTRNFLAGINK